MELATRNEPRPLPMNEIEAIAARAARDPSLLVLRAGTPMPLPAPHGLSDILRRSSIGASGSRIVPGVTLIKNAPAFRQPAFTTTNSVVKDGFRRHHYATVNRTQADDVVHESYYVAPGDHLQPKVEVIGGRRYRRYWRVSAAVSDIVRRAEQEHLDDARRAFELTYKRVADAINALAGTKFGPAETPGEAEALAKGALAARLPAELGIDPANWASALERLLGQSTTRDRKGWHFAEIGAIVTEGDRIFDVLKSSAWANIGVDSSRVVNY